MFNCILDTLLLHLKIQDMDNEPSEISDGLIIRL